MHSLCVDGVQKEKEKKKPSIQHNFAFNCSKMGMPYKEKIKSLLPLILSFIHKLKALCHPHIALLFQLYPSSVARASSSLPIPPSFTLYFSPAVFMSLSPSSVPCFLLLAHTHSFNSLITSLVFCTFIISFVPRGDKRDDRRGGQKQNLDNVIINSMLNNKYAKK